MFQALDGSRLGLGCWEAPGRGPSPGFLWLNILQIDGGSVLYSFEILIFYLSPQASFPRKEDSHALKMSERPTRTKSPTAKLTDANNTEPLALSSHHDSVAAHARARAQAAQSTPSSVDTSVNNVNPATAPVNQPTPSVPASPDIEPPISNKRSSKATVTDEEEDSDAEVLSDTTPAKSKKKKQKRARNEAGVFF